MYPPFKFLFLQPIAVLWNFAIHGVCYGPENMLASGDIMGKASEFIEEKLNVPCLFVNSDAGDIDPNAAACDNAPNFDGAMNISTAVINLWNSLTPTTNVQIASASQVCFRIYLLFSPPPASPY